MAIQSILYNGINVNIIVRAGGLDYNFVQKRNQNRSGSGKIQTINQYGIQEISVTAIFEKAIFHDLVGWWSWARQGKTFAFSMDWTKYGNTVLDGAAAAGQKVIPLYSTTNFAVGNKCLIRAEDNDDEFEITEIASISAGVSVTVAENLIFSYTSGDTYRFWRYWPTLVCLNNDFNPQKIRGSSYYEFTFKFAEKL